MQENVRRYRHDVPSVIVQLGINVVLPGLVGLTIGLLMLGGVVPSPFSNSAARPAPPLDLMASLPFPRTVRLPQPNQVVYVRMRQTDGEGKLELVRDEWSRFAPSGQLIALRFTTTDARGTLLNEGWSDVTSGQTMFYDPVNRNATISAAFTDKHGIRHFSFFSSDFALPGRNNSGLNVMRNAAQLLRLRDRLVADERVVVVLAASGGVTNTLTISRQSGRLLSDEEALAEPSGHMSTTVRTVVRYSILSGGHARSFTDMGLPPGTHCRSWGSSSPATIGCPPNTMTYR